MFTSNDLIKYCVNINFQYNCIKHLKYLKKIHLSDHEIIIKIKNKEIYIIESHDHQDYLRVNFILSLIKEIISTNDNIQCVIILNTGDGCSDIEKYSRLCFSSSYSSKHIQIPDPHIFKYYRFVDNIQLKDKQNKIIFVGSDTGVLDNDLINERIRFCHNTQNIDHIYAKITNFVHFNSDMLKDLHIDINKIYAPFMPIEYQLSYKYILNISGNTASWDRIPWAMKSNSYLINLNSQCNQYNWYYPYIAHTKCLESVSLEDIKNQNYHYNEIIKNKQKHIANIILNPEIHKEYLQQVIIKYNQEYNS